MWVRISPPAPRQWLIGYFDVLVSVVGFSWYFPWCLLHFSNGQCAEPPFLCSLSPWVSSVWKCLFKPFDNFSKYWEFASWLSG